MYLLSCTASVSPSDAAIAKSRPVEDARIRLQAGERVGAILRRNGRPLIVVQLTIAIIIKCVGESNGFNILGDCLR